MRSEEIPEISVVVPCLNEEETIPIFYEETSKVLRQMGLGSFEFIFVDDGLTDGTLEVLRSLNFKDGNARFISFSRNFGK